MICRSRRVFPSDKWEFWQRLHFLLGVRKSSKVKLIFSTSDSCVEADMLRALGTNYYKQELLKTSSIKSQNAQKLFL